MCIIIKYNAEYMFDKKKIGSVKYEFRSTDRLYKIIQHDG